MKKISALLVIFTILFLNLPAARAQNSNWQAFEAYVNKILADWEVPGAAVAIVKDDKIVYAKGFGVKEKGKSEKIDERTIFGVASNSKAFTATALAILVDEGKLDWDDKVTKHLPDFRLADECAAREITVRDLLAHRSGLPAYGGDVIWWGGERSRNEIVERVRFVQPRYGFRAAYSYQNIPFIVAGQIIEKVSGKSWDEFVKERILQPLQMKETTISIRAFTDKTNKTEPHFRDFETGKVFPIKWRSMDNGAAAAGINSNALEMANWLRMQLNEGEFEGKRVVSQKNVREIQTPQTLIPFTNPADQPKLKSNFRAYGLGWSLREYAGYKMVTHGGWTDGQLTVTAMIPERKIGVVVLTNIHYGNAYLPIAYRAFDTVLNLGETDWNSYYLKFAKEQQAQIVATEKQLEAARKKDAKPQLALDAYAGDYENELYGKISFAIENGALVVRMSKSPTYIGDARHWENDKFRVFWRDPVAEKTFLEFVVREGKAQSVKMAMTGFIDDAEYEYRRAPAK
jgi:CubicO group peptidase (beta-lactamase class C family)